MPTVAAWVDALKEAFGSDQVRVRYAEENGFKAGTPMEDVSSCQLREKQREG